MLLHPADEARSGRAPQTAFTLYKLTRIPAPFKREPVISRRDGGGFAARWRSPPWIRVPSTRLPLALFRLAYRDRVRDILRSPGCELRSDEVRARNEIGLQPACRVDNSLNALRPSMRKTRVLRSPSASGAMPFIAYSSWVSSERASSRSCTGRICQYRYSAAFIHPSWCTRVPSSLLVSPLVF